MESTDLTVIIPYILLVMGCIFIALPFIYKSTTEKLKSEGLKAEGIVFELGPRSMSKVGAGVHDAITVRFVTEKKEWITSRLKQDISLFYTGQYKVGDKVEVYYDPVTPTNFMITTKQSPLVATVMITCGGIVMILISLYKILIE